MPRQHTHPASMREALAFLRDHPRVDITISVGATHSQLGASYLGLEPNGIRFLIDRVFTHSPTGETFLLLLDGGDSSSETGIAFHAPGMIFTRKATVIHVVYGYHRPWQQKGVAS
jgi:hypothetical protein